MHKRTDIFRRRKPRHRCSRLVILGIYLWGLLLLAVAMAVVADYAKHENAEAQVRERRVRDAMPWWHDAPVERLKGRLDR